MTVLYDNRVEDYFRKLIEILYRKEYFGFRDSAYRYVDSLINRINATIHIKQKRIAPKRFARYGKDMFYVIYPKNKRTTWYVFFNYDEEDDIYFVRYITNNHVIAHLE